MPSDVTSTLRRAISTLETQRNTIDRQISALRTALKSGGSIIGNGRSIRRRKPMSAAQRAAVAKRMKAYWAKRRATATTKKRGG